MAPSVGVPVNYSMPETDGEVIAAAVITHVHDAENGIVDIKVFPREGSISDRQEVEYGIEPGQWMEIVDEKGKPRF